MLDPVSIRQRHGLLSILIFMAVVFRPRLLSENFQMCPLAQTYVVDLNLKLGDVFGEHWYSEYFGYPVLDCFEKF